MIDVNGKKNGGFGYRYGLRVVDEYESDYGDAYIIDYVKGEIIASRGFLKPPHLQAVTWRMLLRKLWEAEAQGKGAEVEKIEKEFDRRAREAMDWLNMNALRWVYLLGWVISWKRGMKRLGAESREWRLLYKKKRANKE